MGLLPAPAIALDGTRDPDAAKAASVARAACDATRRVNARGASHGHAPTADHHTAEISEPHCGGGTYPEFTGKS